MPWISERAAEISWDRLQTLLTRPWPRAGADLCPAEAGAAAAAGYHADALRGRPADRDALQAASRTRPTCTSSPRWASTCRTRRRRTGRCSARFRTSGFTPTIGAAAASTSARFRPVRGRSHAGRRRLGDSDRAQSHADEGAVGSRSSTSATSCRTKCWASPTTTRTISSAWRARI